MYKSLSFYGKLVSFILLVLGMILIKSYNVLLLISGMVFILSFINKEKKYFVLSLILFLSIYILPYNIVSFIIQRICLVIIYGLIILSSLLSLEKRYLFDFLFYRNRTTKRLKGYIKSYYGKSIINEINEESRRVDKYLDEEGKYKDYLNIQAKKKANVVLEDLYLMDRIRFDRFYFHKRNRLSFTWNNYDNLYLGISLLLFIIVLMTSW